MKKIVNSSIINWELFQKLIKGKSKISKEPFTYDSFMKQMKEEYEQNKDNPEYTKKLNSKIKKTNY
jgi:hypothetical protein